MLLFRNNTHTNDGIQGALKGEPRWFGKSAQVVEHIELGNSGKYFFHQAHIAELQHFKVGKIRASRTYCPSSFSLALFFSRIFGFLRGRISLEPCLHIKKRF